MLQNRPCGVNTPPPSAPRPCAWPPQAAARAPNINPKRLYRWQKEGQTPVAAALGAGLDPTTAAALRPLRTLFRRQAQELEMLKEAIALFSLPPDQ